jgi:hypothetical protein
MLNKLNAHFIADLFYRLDIAVRTDLSRGIIADERDYVSRMVTHMNYPFGILTNVIFKDLLIKSEWFAQVNSSSLEQKFGCDFMIVFEVNNQVKVALIEAKWPRVIINPNYCWDYIQKSNKISHFTDQINRQSNWTNLAFIWEMFFYEESPTIESNPFDKYASTCIPHSFALDAVKSNSNLSSLWDNNDLINLIQTTQLNGYNGSNETNIYTMVFNLLRCNYGKPIDISPSDSFFYLKSNDNEEQIQIPILKFDQENTDKNSNVAYSFIKENGLKMFQYLKIEQLKKK